MKASGEWSEVCANRFVQRALRLAANWRVASRVHASKSALDMWKERVKRMRAAKTKQSREVSGS